MNPFAFAVLLSITLGCIAYVSCKICENMSVFLYIPIFLVCAYLVYKAAFAYEFPISIVADGFFFTFMAIDYVFVPLFQKVRGRANLENT